ncbi:peptidoglycan DD-metalloendopeptidase family protein [Pseudaquabacterium inlustre]|uniref:peptidoglycan DD-metalloendopeptidase family protein n=1 Tax=Pseudaquabacterium inlustre TaxID=2984192 RepID=UPI003BF9D935
MLSAKSAALDLLSTCNATLRRHPRRLTTGVVAVLAGFGATAFGIAPLVPDAATLPQRVVTQELQIAGLDAQVDALAAQPLELSHSDVTRASDTADTLLRRLGVADPLAAAVLRHDADARRLIDGRGGKMVQVRTAADGTLTELIARFPALSESQAGTHFTRLTLRRDGARITSQLETAPLQRQVRLGSGTVRTSLFAATDDARLPDAIASQMIEAFSGDIDFHRQLRKGDSFSVVFEALTADDQPITWNDATGHVLAAEFTNNGKTHQALWFADARTGKGSWFGLDGKSRRRAFLASPLAFSRVTSGFAMRFHPILQSWRAHNGVDYGAPTGTPVKAVGDGVVDFAGQQGGYGNVVQIKHGADKTTVYAHLSRIDVRKGQKIEQGQRIGAVGASGWATGPHLHFEYRVNGAFQDPLKVARAAETVTIDAAARPQFMQLASTARSQLAAAVTTVGGFRGDAE